jgi:hypothetical protein
MMFLRLQKTSMNKFISLKHDMFINLFVDSIFVLLLCFKLLQQDPPSKEEKPPQPNRVPNTS